MALFLRNYVATFFTPTPFITTLLVVGVVFLWARRNSKIGPILVTTGVLGLAILGLDPVTEYLLDKTEMEYPAFQGRNQKINHVVVLAGGFVPNNKHPLTTQLTKHTIVRLVEGIKIHRQFPDAILVVSGKGWVKNHSEAQAMKEMAVDLGVAPEKILLEEESNNTADHTKYLAPIVGKDPFVLVTSALHMPRAMMLFKKAGFKPIPAPTGHINTGEYQFFNIKKPFITGDNLEAIDIWFMEFWGRLKS